MAEIKPKVTEKDAFKNPDKSTLKTLFRKTGISRFLCREQNHRFFKGTLLYK